MIEEVVSVELPVHERLVVRKNRLTNEENGIDMPRISIVTGTHGDELDGQYICYEVIRRIEREKNKLKGIESHPRGMERKRYFHSVFPFFIGNRSAADHSLSHCLSDPVHKNVQKYGE